jgi:hypothetical protein
MLTQEERDQALKKFDAYLESRSEKNPLRETNMRKLKRHCIENQETKEYRNKMKRRFGIDPLVETDKFPQQKESFSWKKFRGQLEEQLREADAESAFPNFVIAGLLQNIIGMYQLTKMSYQDWATITPTNLLETPYAGLQGLSFPREVGSQMPYPEVLAAGYNGKLRAKKYGSMYSVEKELLDDDQTGQFKQQTGSLGEYLQMLTEVLCYGKLASVSNMSYSGFDVPTSETKPSTESNWPFATAASPFVGGGFNRPATYTALTQAGVQAGIQSLMLQKNLLGIVMNVNPNRLLISPVYRFDAAVLMNSAYYPSGAAAAGSVGGAFSVNPIQGLLDVSVSRFMPDNSGVFAGLSKAWYLTDDSKPWFQVLVKTPVSVEQENPTSGESFNRDIYRFKASTRMNADVIDPRFAWRGNDGSV